jgi:hypothetical protein
MIASIPKDFGSQLPAGITIDAGLVHKEIAGHVFGDGAAAIGHISIVARCILDSSMELKSIPLEIPEVGGVIVGQAHCVRSVEGIYAALVNTVPHMKLGVALIEISGSHLTRVDGNKVKALCRR